MSILNYPANHLWGNISIVCPYCKASKEDDELIEGEKTWTCTECDQKFWVNKRLEIRWDSVGDCESNKEMPHHLILSSPRVMQYTCLKCKGEIYDFQLLKIKESDFIIVKNPLEEIQF